MRNRSLRNSMSTGPVKRSGSQERVRRRGSLSLDFIARDLVFACTHSELSAAGHDNTGLHAIYLPTRGRSEYVSCVVRSLSGASVPVYVIPTLGSDMPAVMPADPCVEQLVVQDPEFLGAIGTLRCQSNRLCIVDSDVWDLPLKRNYALWHATKHRFRRILLLDDDIRGVKDADLRAGASALARWVIAGFSIDDFPDTSVVGHAELALGEPAWPFLSGSCLFVQAALVGPFPPIYNEDLICMAPEIAQENVVALGVVSQEPYDAFARTTLAAWQEPGEVIADGLFALLAADRYDERLEPSTWRTLLSLRRRWLKDLRARVIDSQHRAAVDCARDRCHEITEWDCVGFLDDWERDRQQWGRSLEELS